MDRNGLITHKEIHSMISPNFIEMNNVLEIPAYDEIDIRN